MIICTIHTSVEVFTITFSSFTFQMSIGSVFRVLIFVFLCIFLHLLTRFISSTKISKKNFRTRNEIFVTSSIESEKSEAAAARSQTRAVSQVTGPEPGVLHCRGRGLWRQELLLHQQSYAMKNQLRHPKPPARGFGTQKDPLQCWFFMA